MNEQILIRKANYADLEQISKIELICFPKEEVCSKQNFDKRLRSYSDRFFVLEKDRRIIGFINGFLTNEKDLFDEMYSNAALHDKNGTWQMIFGLDVLPGYRNKGYAELLIKYLIDLCREEKRHGIVLICKERLIHYYSKFGFIDEGVSGSTHGDTVWHQMRLTF